MSDRYLSDPLEDLLERAGLSPVNINMALDELANTWQPTVLKPGHVLLGRIRERTDVNVVGISRRYRRLLVEIKQFKAEKFRWHYHERNRSNCFFACEGDVPHTVSDNLPGGPLRALIVPTPALGAVTIDRLSRDRVGWLNLTVTPQWRVF